MKLFFTLKKSKAYFILIKIFQNEVAAHSVYNSENVQLTGVPLPGRRRPSLSRSAPHNAAGMLDPARQPQTMEELLERQWEHSSRFLMEQSSYFDIASLLSSLHQFKEENQTLEDVVDRLLSKRDRLLAVNARLLALDAPHLTAATQPPPPERQENRRGDPPPPSQNGPTSGVDKRLVSPISNSSSSRAHISPSPAATSHEKPLPSPRDRPPLPSPRERMAQPSSSVGRDRDRSPRLPPHHGMENGLDSMYSRSQPPLLTVAHSNSSSQHHRQHSPSGPPPPPPKPAHYPHNASLPPQAHSRHPELRAGGGHYPPPSSYQMVSPPAPKGMVGGPPLHQGGPLPAHSVHTSHRSTPPRPHPPPPHHGPPPPSHHNTPPPLPPSHHGIHSNIQQLMRVSPQSQLHHKK